MILLALFSCGILAWVLSAAMRRYALSVHLMDHPNERSSHTTPTPRGGGLAFVVSFLLFATVLQLQGSIAPALYGSLVGGGLLVAMAGFVDDWYTVSAKWRLAAHVVAAIGSVWAIGPIPASAVFGVDVDLHLLGTSLAVLYMVWLVNLYNFMDGIDGIASIEAVTVCVGGAIVHQLASSSASPWLALAFAACVGGFLAWNYPPAKMFMGDAGSGFIGFVIGLLSVWAATESPQLFWSWAILTGCFTVDASTTLIRRVIRGERVLEPHRTHAYQYASRKHKGHKPVSLAVGVINVCWLLPWAALVASGHLNGIVGLIVSYIPLLWLALHYKAGAPAEQQT